jgi:hypothetical protein
MNICAFAKSIYPHCCHSGLDPESSLWISGFPLEFIPMKIGAGMTPYAQFIMPACLASLISVCLLPYSGTLWLDT